MNFKRQLHTTAPTTLKPYEIIANIQFELKAKKYVTGVITKKSV